MTISGKKYSKSENFIDLEKDDSLAPLTTLLSEIHYIVFDQDNSSTVYSPVTGFLNIIFPTSSSPCITPYFLRDNSFIIRGGENIIHYINEGECLEWKNTYGNNIAIGVFIDGNLLTDFKHRFYEESQRFENGLLTKSDNRVSLIVNEILDLSKRAHQINNLRIQSLLIDVLVHQIEGLYAENDKKELILNKNHYDKIVMAKSTIDKDLSKNYTISELAKYVGTNEQYLKKYFKQHYGKTVMGYITEKKMEHAKELMMTGNYRVADVARLTGYKHSTHFTTAFKKYFGFIPNSLRYTYLLAHGGAQLLSELENFIGLL